MCSMQNSETEPVKYRELLHLEAKYPDVRLSDPERRRV